jgi:hypothetical protein
MSRYVRVSLPVDVADALVDDGLAVRPLGTRGGPLSEAITIGVEAVNTGSALVTIGVTVTACRRIARALLHRRDEADPDELTLDVVSNGAKKTLRINRTAPDAADKALDFLITALNVE